MPRQKYDKYEMIVRNYPIKCKQCKKLIFITYEDDTCPYCKAWICPDCLTILNKENVWVGDFSSDKGHSLTVTCNNCGYDVVDTDL